MYIFSEKRTVYQYEPDYGVDSPEFRRSLDAPRNGDGPGNRAALLQNADEIFPRCSRRDRGRPRSSINLEMYIFTDERDRNAFRPRPRGAGPRRRRSPHPRRRLRELARAAPAELEKAGAQVRVYKPLRIYSIDTIGNRTHRRILTVDGRIGFCGGVGLDDRWKGRGIRNGARR